MPAGRPSEYDFELCVEICDLVANGEHIFDILNSDDRFPSWPTFRRWKQNNDKLRTLYVNAQQDKSESCTHNIVKVQQLLRSGEIEASAANVLIQTDKWFSSKFYPKMYGDRINTDVTSDGEKVEQVFVIGGKEIKFD